MNARETDQLGRRLKAISGDIKLYIEKRVELLLLDVGEHFSKIMAQSVHKIAGFILLVGGAVFLLVALAQYLGDLLGNESLGYVVVSVPMLLLGLLFVYLKPKSMLDRIQYQFEKEIIRAISTNGERKDQHLELKKPEHPTEEEVKSK